MSAETPDEPEDATANYLQDPRRPSLTPRRKDLVSSPSRGSLRRLRERPSDGPAVDDLVDQLIAPASVENSGRMAESQGAHLDGDTPNDAARRGRRRRRSRSRRRRERPRARKERRGGLGEDSKSSSSLLLLGRLEPSDFELRSNPPPSAAAAVRGEVDGWGNEDDLDEDDDPAEDAPAEDAPASDKAKHAMDPALAKGLDAFDELEARSNGVKSTRATQAKAAAAAAAKETNWGAMSAQFTALTGDSTRGGRGAGRGGRGGGRGGRGGRGRGRTALPPGSRRPSSPPSPSWS